MDGEKKTVLLRMAQGLHNEIQSWADSEFRSVNSQIEYILSEAVKHRKKNASDKDDGPDTDKQT